MASSEVFLALSRSPHQAEAEIKWWLPQVLAVDDNDLDRVQLEIVE